MSGLCLTDVRHAIRNSMGTRPSLFVPELAFEMLVKRQIGLLRDLCLRVVDLCHDELAHAITIACAKHFERFTITTYAYQYHSSINFIIH